MYGSDTDPDNDSVEPDFVINDDVSNSSIVKPIPNPPLKMIIRATCGNPRIVIPSFSDHSDDDLLNNIDDLLPPRKPTARSLRTLGVKHPNGSKRGHSKSKKQKVKASVTICSDCHDVCDGKYIKCEVCLDPYHMECAGIYFKKDIKFYCENCTELMNGV